MRKEKKIEVLCQKDCKKVTGGSFAWDFGWLLGNSIAGNFLTPAGTAEALADYAIHYSE